MEKNNKYTPISLGNLVVKNFDEEQRIVTFYASIFGTPDRTGEIVRDDAFDKSIVEFNKEGSEASKTIKHLRDHDPSKTPVGKLLEITKDEKGLVVSSRIPRTKQGDEDWINYKEGIYTDHSFMGYVKKSHIDEKTKAVVFTEIELMEVSTINGWGAHADARTIAIKNLDEQKKKINELNKEVDELKKQLRHYEKSHHEAVQLLIINNKLKNL